MQIYVNRYELYSWVKTYIDMKFQNCEPAGTQLSSHHIFLLGPQSPLLVGDCLHLLCSQTNQGYEKFCIS